MNKKRVLVIIPARMAASRFHGKPIAKIMDLPMIEHVRRRVCLSDVVDEVYVATCDGEIKQVVQEYGGKVIMTSNKHQRCTDRVEEAAQKIDGDIIIIVQGDEPLLDPTAIDSLVKPMMEDNNIECVNLLSVIDHEDDLQNIDVVKAVLNNDNYIMYYSRAPIPYFREMGNCRMYRQTGLSAFKRSFLNKFSKLTPTPKEKVESIDFLRILEHGYQIKAVVYSQKTVGVDREKDISVVEKVINSDSKQKKLYNMIMKEAVLK